MASRQMMEIIPQFFLAQPLNLPGFSGMLFGEQ
jgi:hypothetical protein